MGSYKRQVKANALLLAACRFKLAALLLSVEQEERIVAELGFETVGRHRAAEQVTLYFVAAVFAQEVQLLVGLHAFGDHRQVQAVGHGDNGAGDLGVLFAAGQAIDEGAVDFQHVDGELLVARAEVVHRDAQAQVLQAGEDLQGFADFAHQDAFGQFQLQARRR